MKLSVINYSIKECISKDKIDRAIDYLHEMAEEFSDNDINNQILMLESQYASSKKQQTSGTINPTNYELHINKIKFLILELADSIQKEILIDRRDSEIFIKKIGSPQKITLKFLKRSTEEIFQFKVNPNIITNVLGNQILVSLEPDLKKNFLFRDGRVIIQIMKMLEDKTLKNLDMDLTIKENELNEGDTIVIDFEIKNPNSTKGGRIFWIGG